jgi:hypothetical protein
LRRSQLGKVLEYAQRYDGNTPIMVAGDFNLDVFGASDATAMSRAQFREAALRESRGQVFGPSGAARQAQHATLPLESKIRLTEDQPEPRWPPSPLSEVLLGIGSSPQQITAAGPFADHFGSRTNGVLRPPAASSARVTSRAWSTPNVTPMALRFSSRRCIMHRSQTPIVSSLRSNSKIASASRSSFCILHLRFKSKYVLNRKRIAVTIVMQHRDGHHIQKNSACWADDSLLQFRSRLQPL